MTSESTPSPAAPPSTDDDASDDSHTVEQVPSEVADSEATLGSYDILTYPADYPLDVLVDKWRKEQIEVPAFQRRFVWTQVQSSKLIDSFLKGLPVPPIFLFQDLKSQKLLVVDGQQRIRTIVDFFDGYFGEAEGGKRTIFALKGLEEGSRFEGVTYGTLEHSDPVAFAQLNDSVLRAMIIRQLHPADDTSVYHVFERLNTGGTRLTLQEIRNCVLHGPFNDMLLACNEFDAWRRVFGRPLPDKRQRDVELILRFFALSDEQFKYKKPMKEFLNSFMKVHRTANEILLDELSSTFQRTAQLVLDNLGEKPFHIRAGLNAAVFDSVFVAISRLPASRLENLNGKFRSLISNGDFIECATSGTTDEEIVAKRMRLATDAFG